MSLVWDENGQVADQKWHQFACALVDEPIRSCLREACKPATCPLRGDNILSPFVAVYYR